jgi:hypothetical protein
LLLLFFIGCAQAPVVAPSASPRAPERHDFGKITQGDVVSHEFEIRNQSSEAWIFSEPKTACPKCTEVELGATRLAPGESTKLKLTFNSVHTPGLFEFETVLPRESGVELGFVITGQVSEVLTWEPDFIDLSEKDVHYVTIRSKRFLEGMELVGVVSTGEGLDIRPVDLEGEEQMFEIDGSALPEGEAVEALFQTNDQQVPNFPVVVIRP